MLWNFNFSSFFARKATPNISDISSEDHEAERNELAGLSPEEIEIQRAEWIRKLQCVEVEISALRTIVAGKVRITGQLKRKLGIFEQLEITEDMNHGFIHVKENKTYQKTESVLKVNNTSTFIGGLTAEVSSRLGLIRNSNPFRAVAEQVESKEENIKTKVSTSPTKSMRSINAAFRECKKSADPVVSESISENPIGKS